MIDRMRRVELKGSELTAEERQLIEQSAGCTWIEDGMTDAELDAVIEAVEDAGAYDWVAACGRMRAFVVKAVQERDVAAAGRAEARAIEQHESCDWPGWARDIAMERDTLKEENALLQKRLGFTYCAYCGAEFQADAPEATEAVGAHIHSCPKHPMRDVERERDAWKKRCEDETRLQVKYREMWERAVEDAKNARRGESEAREAAQSALDIGV